MRWLGRCSTTPRTGLSTGETARWPSCSIPDELAGREAEIDQVLEILREIVGPSNQVAMKSPNVGVREALEHWDAIAEITVTLMRIRSENISSRSDR